MKHRNFLKCHVATNATVMAHYRGELGGRGVLRIKGWLKQPHKILCKLCVSAVESSL